MRNATMLIAAATMLAAPACRRQAGENPRCRIFEEDPAKADPSAWQQLREAYGDLERLAECARAAGMTVEEYVNRYRVQEHLDTVTRKLESAAQAVTEGAQQTVHEVESRASQMLQQSERRIEEGIEAVRKLAE